MAKLEMKKGDPEFDAYADLYNFHKAYGTPEPNNDQYWKDIVREAGEINAKYIATDMGGIVARHLIQLMAKWDREVKHDD